MLPKIDSPEWANWGVPQKLDALNEALQYILAPTPIVCSDPPGSNPYVKAKPKKRK